MTDEPKTRGADPQPSAAPRRTPALDEMPVEDLADVHGGQQVFVKTLTGKTITLGGKTPVSERRADPTGAD